MLKPQSSPYTAPRWLKWALLITGILLILGLSLAVWMYIDINGDRKKGHEQAASFAKSETEISQIEKVSTYHGEREIHVVQGLKENEDSLIVFMDLKDEKILDTVSDKETLSIEEMKGQWADSCSACTFKDVQYGYEENEPVYQLTYTDGQNRYVLDYFTLTGDSFDQRFAFRKKE
ncbi:cell wall elongation regulator TseB-like domain-containing protein [Halobacillus sp. H74]|uniref:cell wall elongation regulator TseB-like domain-containing protein n=1 Tax=Halobacillus sp. H74 TaxID=3457436 RepID=UPI003FCDF039